MTGDEIGIETTGQGTVAGKVGGRNNIVGSDNVVNNYYLLDPSQIPKPAEQPAATLMHAMDESAKQQAEARLDSTIEGSASAAAKVDAMIEKSILLKARADQASRSADTKRFLSEAYQVLCEAMELDPLNTDAMRHAAVILMELTPEDRSDEMELLERARGILFSPKDDAQRFGLAHTTFLLAKSVTPIDRTALMDARSMFEKMGRTEWVRRCDDILQQQAEPAPQQPVTQQTAVPQQQQAFNPVGSWSIQVSDGSTMTATFTPNLPCQISMTHPFYGQLQGMGSWLWLPMPPNLRVEALFNGWIPYMLSVVITGSQGASFTGYGEDGQTYMFTRTG